MAGNISKFINREISWLSFNSRVLQEADDPTVPLMERIKFLAIFSSNLDEFFRVRVATLKRLMRLGRKSRLFIEDDPARILNQVQIIVAKQQVEFEKIYQQLLQELQARNIFIINETQLTPEQKNFLTLYFRRHVRPSIVPFMASQFRKFPPLNEGSLYLAVRLLKQGDSKKPEHAIVEVPTKELSRFIVLPADNDKQYIMLLEDVIRLGLPEMFSMFHLQVVEAFPIKITKDAELELEDNVTKSFVETISKSVKGRLRGEPVRLTYDSHISQEFLNFLTKRLGLSPHDTLLPERRDLNFKDFMKFPSLGMPHLQYQPLAPLPHSSVVEGKSLLKVIRQKDLLLHYPYQSFHYLIYLLREAAIDPNVTSIRMTLYRVAEKSKIVNALRAAVHNGKKVTVLFEFRARFDEEANIYWANQLIEDGARVIYGMPELKVHAKLCLISRKEHGKTLRYAAIGTGNFNEDTAKLYADHTLLTVDKRITNEVRDLFDFLKTNYKLKTYQHLLVSPFFMRNRWKSLIQREIQQAQSGKEAYILIKLNSLMDRDMVECLYRASQAGVKIRLVVRGICSLRAGIPGLSENIEAISIIDKFLEHSRIFIFCNGGKEKYFIGSADWMTRNLDNRVEVACPIYDRDVQQELRAYFELQWQDTVKARILDGSLNNYYRQAPEQPPVRSQQAIYEFLQQEHASETKS